MKMLVRCCLFAMALLLPTSWTIAHAEGDGMKDEGDMKKKPKKSKKKDGMGGMGGGDMGGMKKGEMDKK